MARGFSGNSEAAKAASVKAVALRKVRRELSESVVLKGIGVRELQKMVREAVCWVAENGVKAPQPTESARSIQDMRRRNSDAFLVKMLMPIMPSPPKEAALPAVVEDKEREVVGDSL